MSKEEFERQLEIAKSIVEKWPAWKQNILQTYASPTVAVARVPVDNFERNRLAELAACCRQRG